jgi:hypothetical protein
MAIYTSDLRNTINTTTGKVFYYIRICGVWCRVSKSDYFKRDKEAFRCDCFMTIRKGNLITNIKTIYVRAF